jgi:hypothetical protein
LSREEQEMFELEDGCSCQMNHVILNYWELGLYYSTMKHYNK